MAKTKKSERVPKEMEEIFQKMVTIIDGFCNEHLDEEYRVLSRFAAAALARKRPSPLKTGKLNSWACGVVYAIGYNNFLSDKSVEPYMSMKKLCENFGISSSSGGNYSKKVRDALKITRFDHTWMVPSMIESSPTTWMLMVNGLFVDIRNMPREVQVQAYEKGYIPYIPADREL